MMRVVVATIAIVITSGCRTATPAPLPMFEPSQIVDHAETLRVRVAGESVSVAILQLHVLSESVVSLIASASNDSLTQEILMTFDRVSLKPTRVRASNALEVVDLVYSSERVWGKRVVWNPAGGQDTMDVNAP